MNKLLLEALEELDNIVEEEYGFKYSLKLYEANEDDEKFVTPLKRVGSFPARAIRFRKAKAVMKKYEAKILRKAEKIIKRFESEIDKSIPVIKKRGEELEAELKAAKKSGDDVAARAIINQQKKFTKDVEENQQARLQNLNQSIENLINTYTQAIHKRIDEPGYVLRVELSEKGKAELKFLWDEKVATIKQQIYEKLVRIINNKNIKGLESLISKLEIEIENAEDERLKNRRRRSERESERESSEYSLLVKYLNDGLPEGLLPEGESYKAIIDYGDQSGELLDVYIELDEGNETISAIFWDPMDSKAPVFEREIKDEEDVDELIKEIEEGEEKSGGEEARREKKSMIKHLENLLDVLFQKESRTHIKSLGGQAIFDRYKDNTMKVATKIVNLLFQDPEENDKTIKSLNRKTRISDSALILLLNQFQKELKDVGTKKINPEKEKQKILEGVKSSLEFFNERKESTGSKTAAADLLMRAGTPFGKILESILEAPPEVLSYGEKMDILKKMKDIFSAMKNLEVQGEDWGSNIRKKVKNFVGDKTEGILETESFIPLSQYKKINS